MAKNKHTPGPWLRSVDGFVCAMIDDEEVIVADFDCSKGIDLDEREANKALAIAAPEMFAALADHILPWLEIICEAAPDDDLPVALRNIARAALTKACGEG